MIPYTDKELRQKHLNRNSQTKGCSNWFASQNKRKAKLKASHIEHSNELKGYQKMEIKAQILEKFLVDFYKTKELVK